MDVCDQTVFALTKEIHSRYPEKFGSGSYFCLFGRLHFEKCMLTIHGELIKYWHVNYRVWGSGSLGLWFKSYQTAALFPSGILLCTVLKLKDAKNKSGSTLSSIKWLEQSKNWSEMCHYWYLIVTLQTDILWYERPLRESNYNILIHTIKSLMNLPFSFDN